MKKNDNVLNIDSDDLNLDLLRDIDKAFDIKLSGEDVATVETVSDLFTAIRKHVNVVERSEALPCFTNAVFFALKAAVIARGPNIDVGPKTPLQAVCGTEKPERIWRQLQESSRLRLPPLRPTATTQVVALLLVILSAVCGAIVGLDSSVDGLFLTLVGLLPGLGLGAIAGVVAGGFVLHFGPHGIPNEIKTVGDLASATAKLNIGDLAKPYGAVRERDAWSALLYLIRQYLPPGRRLDAESRFYPKRS